MLDRTVEDVGTGVVADGAGLIGLDPESEVAFVGAEDDAVQVLNFDAVVLTPSDDGAHRRLKRVQIVESQVAQGNERKYRLEFDLQPRRVAESAVRVGKAPVQVRVLALGCCREDLTATGEDVDLEYRLVRKPAAERRRLDAESGDRAAEGDRLELRNDERGEAVGQRRVDQILVRAHPRHVGGASRGIDGDDLAQSRDVESRRLRGRPGPKQVGRLLSQTHRRVGRYCAIAAKQLLDTRPMRCVTALPRFWPSSEKSIH